MKPINKYIDHTLLRQDATLQEINHLCKEAIEYDFYSVCVNSCYVSHAYNLLKNTDVKVVAVIGFPLGATTTSSKAFEAKDACKNGASEIDMVINCGMLKSNEYEYVTNDIKSVVNIASQYNAIVKVILETCLLTDEEIIKACQISKNAGAAYVKTSTGFSNSGATEHSVELMRATVGDHMGVKASGGIRDYNTAIAMVNAGASRIGVSASIEIMIQSIKQLNH